MMCSGRKSAALSNSVSHMKFSTKTQFSVTTIPSPLLNEILDMSAYGTKKLPFQNTISDEITCGWSHDKFSHTHIHACKLTHVHTYTLPPNLLHDFWNHQHYDQNSWRDPIRGHAAVSKSGSCAWKPGSSTVGPYALKETEEWGWPLRLAKWAAALFEGEQRLWRVLVYTELNGNHEYVFKSFKIFNLAEIWFLSLI